MKETQAQISIRQSEEWSRFRAEILMPLYDRVAGGDEKNAKTLADIIKIAQEGERKAAMFDTGLADTKMDIGFMAPDEPDA